MDQLIEFFTRHLGLMAGLCTVMLAIIVNEIHGNLTGGKKLAAPEAVRLINDREAFVIDTRPPADFKKGHLMGASNIPAAKIKDRLNELPKDKTRPIIVYCALGGSSREPTLELRNAGYTEVYPLAGGLNAWVASGLPTTSK